MASPKTPSAVGSESMILVSVTEVAVVRSWRFPLFPNG